MIDEAARCDDCGAPATVRGVEVSEGRKCAYRYCRVHEPRGGILPGPSQLARLVRYCRDEGLMARNGYTFDRVKRELAEGFRPPTPELRRPVSELVLSAATPAELLSKLGFDP